MAVRAARFRELDRIGQEIDEHAFQRRLVAPDDDPLVSVVLAQGNADGFGARVDQAQRRGNDVTGLDDSFLQAEGVGLDLGEIQNVGDHRQQVPGAVADIADIALISR
jgi:hypothetical protein